MLDPAWPEVALERDEFGLIVRRVPPALDGGVAKRLEYPGGISLVASFDREGGVGDMSIRHNALL